MPAMSNRRKRRMLVRLALFTFVMGEAAGFYMVSLLLLRQAKSYGDPLLQSLAWICVGAMGAGVPAFFYSVARIYKKFPC